MYIWRTEYLREKKFRVTGTLSYSQKMFLSRHPALRITWKYLQEKCIQSIKSVSGIRIKSPTKLRKNWSLFKRATKTAIYYYRENKPHDEKIPGLKSNEFQSLINNCLRRILNITWTESKAKEVLWERSGQEPIQSQISRREWPHLEETSRRCYEGS